MTISLRQIIWVISKVLKAKEPKPTTTLAKQINIVNKRITTTDHVHVFSTKLRFIMNGKYILYLSRSLSLTGAFPLQICTKLWRYFINVDKKVLRYDSISINQCYVTKTIFSSRDKSWQRILVGFWLYLIEGDVCMYLYKSSAESCFRNVCGAAHKHKHRLEWPRSTPVAVSEPHCAADVCSVNCLSINGRQSPSYLRAATY